MRIEFCKGCGAPLQARWSEIVLQCSYCGAQNAPGEEGEPVPSSIPDDGRLRLAVGGRTYLVLGTLAQGDSSIVYRGRWVRRLGEQVVLKVLRSPSDEDLFRREWAFLERLQGSSAKGTEHFVSLLPEPISMGQAEVGDRDRMTSVFRWRSGFYLTLERVMDAHRDGVEPGSAVWIFKRLLELLSWVHRTGVAHCAVLPPHVLVHPLDHGAMLVGWTAAAALDRDSRGEIVAFSRRWRDWYPEKARNARRGSPSVDIAMAARCCLRAAGASDFDKAGRLPRPLDKLLIAAAEGRHADAWDLREQVSQASLDALGPPQYCPIEMPGWPSGRS